MFYFRFIAHDRRSHLVIAGEIGVAIRSFRENQKSERIPGVSNSLPLRKLKIHFLTTREEKGEVVSKHFLK